MSAARVAKLEALLGRIAQNRRPIGAPAIANIEAKRSAQPPLPTHAVVDARPAPSAPGPVPAPKPIAAAPSPEPILEPPMVLDERPPSRATRPTPMEQAVVVELETLTPREPSSVDVEITLDDDGTEISIDADGDDDDAFDGFDEGVPTAPVEMRAPTPPPVIITPVRPQPEPDEEEETLDVAPPVARPFELASAKPSAPVAKVVSRHAPTEPETFGELLDRTLALRPR